jgi:hypothetical protein
MARSRVPMAKASQACGRRIFYVPPKKRQRSSTKRDPMVDRTLKEGGLTITAAEPPLGQIRIRNGGSNDFSNWTVALNGPASSLKS